MSDAWPAYYPKYLPFPSGPIGRSTRPVPNRTAVDMAQAQLAPLYLAPGSASVQSYTYKDGPYPPMYYTNRNLPPYNLRPGVGPGGDIAQLPRGSVAYPFSLGDAVESSMSEFDFSPIEAKYLSRVSAHNQDRIRRLERRITEMLAAPMLMPEAARMRDHLLGVHAKVKARIEAGPRGAVARRRAVVRSIAARMRARRVAEQAQVESFRERLAAYRSASQLKEVSEESRIARAAAAIRAQAAAPPAPADQTALLLARRKLLVDRLRDSWRSMSKEEVIDVMQKIKQTSEELGLPVPAEIPIEAVRVAMSNPRSRFFRQHRRVRQLCK